MTKDEDGIDRARAAKQGSPFLNTEQAAAYLGMSARKLQYMRSRCTGPRYRLHSRFVRYHSTRSPAAYCLCRRALG